jgi:hypothetical protein
MEDNTAANNRKANMAGLVADASVLAGPITGGLIGGGAAAAQLNYGMKNTRLLNDPATWNQPRIKSMGVIDPPRRTVNPAATAGAGRGKPLLQPKYGTNA